MCGILGVFRSAGGLPSPELFARSLERLRRRGPDDGGVWSDDSVRLGHRRLAIVDLSQHGHQPMESADGRFVIVFNGEIYNHEELRKQLVIHAHPWRSTSDTETLLEAYRVWGVECLSRLRGMFAFAIWDKLERRLFVARDRLGKKPLYYSHGNGVFAFGSRPGAVVPLCGSGTDEVDEQSLRVFLELGYIPAPMSFYKHIHKLRPAHYMLVDAAGLRTFRYWDYRQIPPDPAMLERDEADIVDEIGELICSSVRERLMGDVPVGAFLSGGVDSATVVAAMQAVGCTTPKAFTISFNEQAYDEGPAAARIARHLGVEHVVETLSVTDLLALLPMYVEEFDEPFADSSAFPTMAVSRLARAHVTVSLSGDGGDELFGGYHYYRLIERLSRFNGLPPRLRAAILAILGRLPWHNTKLIAGALRHTSAASLFNFMRGCGKDFDPLVEPGVLLATNPSATLFEQHAASYALEMSEAQIGMCLDLGFMLPDGYLQKVDVASMAFSLEARCPLLDHRMVEWSMRLPTQLKIRGHETKYLLKKLLCRYLPAEYVDQPKRGFGVPVAAWLRGPLRAWAADLIHDNSVMSRLPLDRNRLVKLFELHLSGTRDAHPLLWATLMLLCYVARHDRGMVLPGPTVMKAA